MPNERNDSIRDSRIDTRLESYNTFFDHEFSNRLYSICENTAIEQAAGDLLLSWKAAANTQTLVWMTVHSVVSFHAGFTDANDPDIYIGLNEFAAALMRQGILLPEQQDAVRSAVLDAKLQMNFKRKERAKFDVEDYWNSLLGNGEFQLAIWGSQRLIFSSVFHEYENFLLACLRIKSNDPTLRVKNARASCKTSKHDG